MGDVRLIIADTNVISEPLRPKPDSNVLQWLRLQSADSLALAAPSVAEAMLGIAILPFGRKRTILSTQLSSLIEKRFNGRVLPFDDRAARLFAELVAAARGSGITIGTVDGQIAAIALASGAAVATRDIAPFIAAGVPTINPWQPSA